MAEFQGDREERIGRREADPALIALLARGASIRNAGDELNLSETTIYRRLRSPKFKARLDAVKDAIVAQSITKAADGLNKASETLVSLLDSKTEMVRLYAAKALHDITHRGIAVEALDRRVRQMKQQMRKLKRAKA